MACLRIYRGVQLEQVVELHGRVRIGSDRSNDIVLRDPAGRVDAVHAELRPAGASWELADLGSADGLWAGGRRHAVLPMGTGRTATLADFTLELRPDAGENGSGEPPTVVTTLATLTADDGCTVLIPPDPPASMTVQVSPRPVPEPGTPGARAAGWHTARRVATIGLLVILSGLTGWMFFSSRETHTAPLPSTPADTAGRAEPAGVGPTAVPSVERGPVADARAVPAPPPVAQREAVSPRIAHGPCRVATTGADMSAAEAERRRQEASARFHDGDLAAGRGDTRGALLAFEAAARLADCPGVQDRIAVAQARADLGAKEQMQRARSLESREDYTGAFAAYAAAAAASARVAAEAETATTRLRRRLQEESETAFQAAVSFETRGRRPEAVALYERVVRLLGVDHDLSRQALTRIGALKVRCP